MTKPIPDHQQSWTLTNAEGVPLAVDGVPTLVGFLLARIAEDEDVARVAAIESWDGAHKPHGVLAEWRYTPDGEVEYDYDEPGPYPAKWYVTCDGEGLSPAVNGDVGPHIARHDPARVLAECEAKRRLIHVLTRECSEWGIRQGTADALLEMLALPYADHADFRPEWRS